MGAPPVQGPPYNTIELAAAEGLVVITVLWDWDGVSVWPNFAGTVISVRVRNATQVAWVASLPKKNKGQKSVTIPAGTDVTYSGSALNSGGLNLLANVESITLNPA